MHVPEGWKPSNLSDLVEIHYGKSPVDVKDDKGQYPIIGTGGITGKANKFLCEKDAIIIGRKGSINKPILISEPFWPIDTTFYCLPKNDTNLIWLIDKLKQLRLERFNESTGIPSLSRENLYSIKIQTPPSPEQQKIAKILSTWDKAIEKLEALIAAKQKRKKALMQQLLTGKKRFAEFVKSEGIQKTKFGTVPSDWQYLHIADVAKQFSVKNNAGHDLPVLSCTKHYGLVDSLAYFGKQIFSEDTSTYKVVPRNAFAYATNHIEEGSIGYQNLYDKALISPMYTVFQTKENINDEFLYRLLKTELYRHIFEVNTSASVDRRGSLRWDQFSAIKIPVPSLPEQRKIASVLTAADIEIESHKNQLSALKEQKKGLMQQLLTGKKRVKIDGPEMLATAGA